jgi:hypothetical protein
MVTMGHGQFPGELAPQSSQAVQQYHGIKPPGHRHHEVPRSGTKAVRPVLPELLQESIHPPHDNGCRRSPPRLKAIRGRSDWSFSDHSPPPSRVRSRLDSTGSTRLGFRSHRRVVESLFMAASRVAVSAALGRSGIRTQPNPAVLAKSADLLNLVSFARQRTAVLPAGSCGWRIAPVPVPTVT